MTTNSKNQTMTLVFSDGQVILKQDSAILFTGKIEQPSTITISLQNVSHISSSSATNSINKTSTTVLKLFT